MRAEGEAMFERDSSKQYLMPAVFGPAPGPRQGPNGASLDPKPTLATRLFVSFLGREDELSRLLPQPLELWGDPVVTVEFVQLQQIPWLAGRGYNYLAVRVPACFSGRQDSVRGPFMLVLWENLADPIITGREQLGYPKIFADLPEPRTSGDSISCHASWMGFRFADLELRCDREPSAEELGGLMAGYGDGIIHYKYFPRTGQPWSEADVEYFTMSPVPGASNLAHPQPAPEVRIGTGRAVFHDAAWDDMPTQHHIVSTLASLTQVEQLGAASVRAWQHLDISDQRILV